MFTVLIVIHLLVTLALIGVVLLQKSEGGGLGIGGGGGGGMAGFMTARGTANLLTRATAGLAAVFMGLSLFLAWYSTGPRDTRSFVDRPGASQPATPAAPSPAPPAVPAAPAPPIAR